MRSRGDARMLAALGLFAAQALDPAAALAGPPAKPAAHAAGQARPAAKPAVPPA